MVDLLEGSESFGKNLKFWIGVVAPRSSWAGGGTLINDKEVGVKKNKGEVDVYYNRVKVRVVGYHDKIKDPYDLPWANILATPMLASGYGGKDHTHYLEGGESVFGFWMDGEDEQKPCIVGVFYRHKKAEDATTRALAGSASKPTTIPGYEETPTGGTATKSPATGETKPEVKFSYKPYFSVVTGRIDNDKTKYPTSTNEPGSTGMTQAAEAHHYFLKRKTNRPTCKRDNAIAQITGFLGDFTEYLLTIQGYANFYVNEALGTITDLAGEIDFIAKQIASIMTGLFNAVREQIYILVGEKIQKFVNSILPEEIKPIFGESIKEIMDIIYCIFENLIAALLKTITDFLLSLVGKIINAPICAAEEFVGALLNSLSNSIRDAISPILDTLSETLGGALGKVNEIIGKALEIVGLIFKFIGCDELKCPLPSRFDNAYGPSQQERDNAKKIRSKISLLNIPTSTDKDGNVNQTVGGFLSEAAGNADSIFGEPTDEQKRTADYVAGLVGGCQTGILRCGPPQVEIFGGDGIGGFANAVVNNLGEIIGADVIERGLGYSANKPPYVTFRDACGDGAGARGRAIIGDDGGIDRIVIDYGGYGYRNTFGEVKTIYGTLPGGADSEAANSDSKSVTGQIDDVEVLNPGFGYNADDTTLDAGNGSCLTPVIVGGRIVDVTICNGEFGRGTGFTSIPDITINSPTGIGAELSAVLKFTDVNELSQPLDPAKVVQVINCISK
jgi:hypothetical protein